MDVKYLKNSLTWCVPIDFILLLMRDTFPEQRVEFNRQKLNYLTGFHRISRQIIPMSNKTIYELNLLRTSEI